MVQRSSFRAVDNLVNIMITAMPRRAVITSTLTYLLRTRFLMLRQYPEKYPQLTIRVSGYAVNQLLYQRAADRRYFVPSTTLSKDFLVHVLF